MSKDKKAVMGKLAYYLEGAAELPKQFGKSWKMKFVTDDKTLEEEVLLFMIANSQSVGGFKEIAPLASVSDGLFDAVIIKKMDIFQMLPLMISILQGDHVNHPAVEYVQTKSLHIENMSGEEVKVDYDGEELPEGFPVDISIIPKAIQIVVPK